MILWRLRLDLLVLVLAFWSCLFLGGGLENPRRGLDVFLVTGRPFFNRFLVIPLESNGRF